MLRRVTSAATPLWLTTAASSLPSSAPVNAVSSSLVIQACHMHGKPTTAHKKRTQHTRTWWMQAKARHLTARPHEASPTRPHFGAYSEDVDRPMVVPHDAKCFNCKRHVETHVSYHNYVWVPAGNATYPTPQGYVFHKECFKCWKCKLRLYHNVFFSRDDQAWCLDCAFGRERSVPTRRWHTSFVNSDRTGSRQAGHFFPRHKHQVEFLFNPNE